jgi:uncharacterized protein (DUF1800 family)
MNFIGSLRQRSRIHRMRRFMHVALMGALAVLAACASVPTSAPTPAPAASNSLEDVRWLQRVSFGLDGASLDALRQRGRRGYLEWQLGAVNDSTGADPAALHDQQEALPPAEVLTSVAAENRRIATLPDGPEREAARKALNERANAAAYAAQRKRILAALYSHAQLREQMVSFWLNHFSVYQYKADLRWLIGDYTDRAIRPHALGSFRDLLLAVETHPAMLQYLDNAQNAAGHLNENLARELLELHTLGVHGGYSQQDVQELARILTGTGVDTGAEAPKLKPEWRELFQRRGGMVFNPARHDFGSKTLLGHTIKGNGLGELEEVVGLLVDTPACAEFIARKLVVYFVADEPDPALVTRTARAFHASHGNIAVTLRALLLAPELATSLGQKFKDPEHFVLSALRLAYDGKPLVNMHPIVNWIGSLGQPLYGHQTPDGFADTMDAWASSGQLARRFEVARAIGSGGAGLFEPEDGTPATSAGFPVLMRPVFYDTLQPMLSPATRAALDKATSPQEWNTFLLSSPDFNLR